MVATKLMTGIQNDQRLNAPASISNEAVPKRLVALGVLVFAGVLYVFTRAKK
jgi:hypothetical protein